MLGAFETETETENDPEFFFKKRLEVVFLYLQDKNAAVVFVSLLWDFLRNRQKNITKLIG